MSLSLLQLGARLIQIILPINLFLGLLGNSLNIIILTRPVLYKYASTHYFLALAVNNLFFSSFLQLNDLLAYGYNIDLSTFSLVSCKIIRYLNELCAVLSGYFIVLASIDRYLASSLNVNRRNLSNVKLAKRILLITIGLLALFYINSALLYSLQFDDGLGCYIRRSNLYHRIYPIIQVFNFGVFVPFLMLLFGILTIYNTKQLNANQARITRQRRTERQLTFMLFIQVATYVVLNLPICILYIMVTFLPLTFYTSKILFILIIFLILHEFSYTTPFFLYIVSGHTFRRELLRFFNKILRRHPGNQIDPNATYLENNSIGLATHLATVQRSQRQ